MSKTEHLMAIAIAALEDMSLSEIAASVPPIGSVEVCVSAMIPKEWQQVRFPRSKRNRIRKKWRKDQKNWGMRQPLGVMWGMPGGRILTNQRTFDALRRGSRVAVSVGRRARVFPDGRAEVIR